jgi:hypothetical protein
MSLFFFYKIEEQEGRTGPAWGGTGTSGREEEVGERVWESECSTNTMYTCMQLEKGYLLKLFQEWGEEG